MILHFFAVLHLHVHDSFSSKKPACILNPLFIEPILPKIFNRLLFYKIEGTNENIEKKF